MGRGGESGHVETDLSDDDGGRGRPDPGNLIEPVGRISERGQVLPDLGVKRHGFRAGGYLWASSGWSTARS